MKKNVSSLVALPGRWLADERTYAAMQLKLADSDARLMVSVTALDAGTSPVCTLAIACEKRKLTLELIAAFRIHPDDLDDVDEPDLAMYLTNILRTASFRKKVLSPFVAQMQACGMY